ncbi:hypothetical protein [Streptomyces sp. BA2]|uniref:hypothetical protein n=1 Tax=Streptomyces sp. BA2 TaxID=436595 RepID=UPI001327FF68|nr:hypothetical protein [Streptomyces sp. BA2]MWA08748.1 hypothetical protein [Streptomyces sp. BA2]
MARIQILELPMVHVGDVSETPFLLVIDQVDDDTAEDITHWPEDIATRIGARQVLCLPGTVDIPANDLPPSIDEAFKNDVESWAAGTNETIMRIVEAMSGGTKRTPSPRPRNDGQRLAAERTDIARDMDRLAKWKHELADALGVDRTRDWDDIRNAAAGLRQGRDEARSWARHGYEIGQKHCSWTDHGVAPAWLTDGWPPHIDSCEHLKVAAEYDEALTRVRNLPEQPEVMDAQHPDPSGYLHGYGVAIREAKQASSEPRPTAYERGGYIASADDGDNTDGATAS